MIHINNTILFDTHCHVFFEHKRHQDVSNDVTPIESNPALAPLLVGLCPCGCGRRERGAYGGLPRATSSSRIRHPIKMLHNLGSRKHHYSTTTTTSSSSLLLRLWIKMVWFNLTISGVARRTTTTAFNPRPAMKRLQPIFARAQSSLAAVLPEQQMQPPVPMTL